MSGVRTRRSSKRSKYEASVADEGPQIFGDMENMNMGTSSESIDDLLEDEVSDTLVLPWRVVKRRLQARITQTTSSSQKASAALPTTLPYGFQISRNLAYPKASIRNALFIPGSPDRFATLDTNFMSIWKNGIRTSKVQLVPPDKNASAPLAGLSKWTYAAKLRALFISTTHLEIKMMTPSFGELGAVSSNKPILSLEYNEFKNELITTGTDNVTVWNFKKTDDVLYPYKFDEIRLHMDDFEEDGWVATTVYNHVNNKILAAAGNAVHVFDYGTGERLELLKEVHELSITAMLVLEPYGYFVTASRDTTIKIFNRQFGLLHELHDHTQAVTGLATVPLPATSGSVASVQSAIPFFLSCSLDGTVKMWNAETGACTYSLQTASECLGISWLKEETFMHYAKDRISVWTLHRFYVTFTPVRCAAIKLTRVQYPRFPARILSVAADGSIRLISPVTGTVLTVGFPIISEVSTIAAAYDITQNRAWLLLANGDMAIHDTSTNPTEIIEERIHKAGHARISCMASLLPPNANAIAKISGSQPCPSVYGIWCGTDAGQVVLMDVRQTDRQERPTQAHAAELLALEYDHRQLRLFTGGKDRIIKIWAVTFPEDSALKLLRRPTHETLANWYTPSFAASVTLLLGSTISFPDGLVSHMSWGPHSEMLTIATDTQRVLAVPVTQNSAGALKTHSRDDDHTGEITDLVSCEEVDITASASLDGTVRVWDGLDNTLIRELQFNTPVSSLCFVNHRGDLLIALPDELVLVQIQDYLPLQSIRGILQRGNWPDDVVEDSKSFDSNVDFWGLYRERDQQKDTWHVEKRRRPEDEQDDLKAQQNVKEVETIFQMHKDALMAQEESDQPQPHTRRLSNITSHYRLQTFAESGMYSGTRPHSRESFNQAAAGSVPGKHPRQRSFQALRNQFSDSLRDFLAESQGRRDMGETLLEMSEDDLTASRESTVESGMDEAPFSDEGIPTKRDRSLSSYARELHSGGRFIGGPAPKIEEIQEEVADFAVVAELPRGSSFSDADARDSVARRLRERHQSDKITNRRTSVSLPRERQPSEVEMLTRRSSVFAHSDGETAAGDGGDGAHARPSQGEEQDKRLHNVMEKPKSQRGRKRTPAERTTPRKLDPTVIRPPKLTVPSHITSRGAASTQPQQSAGDHLPPPEEAAARKAAILKGMERLGILPNSMVTGQTESIINQKKLQVERERKDKDRAMLSKVREMIERRRAGEGSRGGTRGGTVSRGATLLESAMMSSVDLTAEKMEVLETEHPDRPVTPHEIQVQDEMQHTTETEEHKRKKTPAKPHSPAKGKREKTPDTRKEPEPLPETQKLKAKKKKVHAATIVARLRVIDPGTGVATVDYSGLGAIRLESISPTSRVRTTQPVQIGVRGVEEPEHAYTPAQPPPPPKPTIDTKPKPFPTTDKPADKLPPLPPLPPAGPLHRGKHNKRRESNAYRPEEIVEEMPTSGGDDSTRFPSAATHISTSRVFTQPDMHQISQSRMSMRSAIRAQSTFSNRFIEEELQVEDIVPELQGIMDAFWFPGMKGQKLTLENIIATLFHVLKTGYWSEKAEASDALLQLYHDFSDEFRDPTMNFVLPQIESLNDRDWQTRVRLCQNLVKYGVSHPMLIHGLIARLLDPHEAVRAAAAKSLAVFEIDTRSSLRNMLQRLHMLPNAALGPQMDWLDVLILRQRDRQAAMEAQSQRNASHWLTTANPICDGRAFTRPPSSFVTLVPPELEGEKFVMPTFTAADNAAAAAAKAAHHRKAKGKPPKVQREVMVEDR